MKRDDKKKSKASLQLESVSPKRRLIENQDFTLAGWPRQYPVPLFTWEELNQILEKNNNKIPDNMWKERMKRKGDHP